MTTTNLSIMQREYDEAFTLPKIISAKDMCPYTPSKIFMICGSDPLQPYIPGISKICKRGIKCESFGNRTCDDFHCFA